ncbi:MAG: hypothetical protein ACR2HV_00250 [Acidimicrobiales bacterium]
MRPSPGGAATPFGHGARGVAITALLIVLVGVADVTVVVRRGRSSPPRPPSALERVLPELESFVARERGLPFRRRVDVKLHDDTAFDAAIAKLRARSRGDDTSPDVLVGLLRALGLVEGRFDPAALDRSIDDRILGYYDSQRDELLVRGDQPTPAVRRVLVHELTHALDDQHFDLDRPELDRGDDEAPSAFAALAEGDAVRVESRYLDTLPPDERSQADLVTGPAGQAMPSRSEGRSGPTTDVPRVFEALLAFPYVAGQSFVEALIAAGGTARVDAAFAEPPATTEAILSPDRYLAGETSEEIDDPPADGPVVDRGVLGELLLRLVLMETLDRDTAVQAAAGWRGDRYTAWSDAGRVCVRDRLVMDTAADRADVVAGLRRWADSHPGADVADAGAGPVMFTRCG